MMIKHRKTDRWLKNSKKWIQKLKLSSSDWVNKRIRIFQVIRPFNGHFQLSPGCGFHRLEQISTSLQGLKQLIAFLDGCLHGMSLFSTNSSGKYPHIERAILFEKHCLLLINRVWWEVGAFRGNFFRTTTSMK